jgi:hypothetical protein
MDKAHYIIFHPDHQRQLVSVQAIAIVNQLPLMNWTGNIYVDKIGVGNEDPFIFNDPWIYSYCHASQLRRNFRKDSFLQVGSKIIFVSGEHADKGILCVDTVFVVGGIQKWNKKPLQLPEKYQKYYQNNKSDLWRRHFRFPFFGIHKTVSHTYEATLWTENKTDFSFLPLDNKANRVSIPFNNFNTDLLIKISGKVKGKYPVLLTENEIRLVTAEIEKATTTKVLKNIISNLIVTSKKGKC